MKARYITLVGLLCLGWLTSCDHNRPDEPTARVSHSAIAHLKATHTIAELKEMYRGTPTTIAQEVVLEATMASDDTEGNLYRTAYVQDATGGLELKLSLGNLSTIYPQGARVFLKAQGMTLGQYAGQINLGYRSLDERYETAYYPEKLVPSVLLKVAPGFVSPRVLTIATLSKIYAGQLVRLDGVQFLASELGQTYAAPDDKQAQGHVNRTLQDRTGATLIVRTSSYAKFAGAQLPTGSGSITAILTYFRDTPQLVLLRERDADLQGSRF